MDWLKEDSHRAFPHLPLDEFDRYPHHYRKGEVWPAWETETFPFDVHSLPRLPRLGNARYRLLSRTHVSLPVMWDTDGDPETESYNFLETMGDAVLRFYATRAVVQHGCAWVGEDLHVIREQLTNNTTLSYVARAYRLDHTVRHSMQLQYPPQKMMGDLLEAYIGAAWQEAEDAGDTGDMEDWLRTFFSPKRWHKWIPMRDELKANGKNKRAIRTKTSAERNRKKKLATAAKRKRAREGGSAQLPASP